MSAQIIRPAFAHLRPGGWLECQEVVIDPFCDDGTMAADRKSTRLNSSHWE